jgi:hypothetical protein
MPLGEWGGVAFSYIYVSKAMGIPENGSELSAYQIPSGREYWKLGTAITKAFEVGKDA